MQRIANIPQQSVDIFAFNTLKTILAKDDND